MDPAPKGQCLLILGGPSSFIQTKFHQEVAQILAKMEVFLGEFHRTRLFPAPQEHSGLPFLSSLKVVVTVRMLGMSLLSPYQPQAADIPTHKLPLKDIKPFTLSQTLHPHVIPCVQPARNSPGLPDQSLSPPSWALGFLSVPPTSTIPHPQAPYPSRLSPLTTLSTQTLGLPTPSTMSTTMSRDFSRAFHYSLPLAASSLNTFSKVHLHFLIAPHSYHMHFWASISGLAWHPVAKIPSQREMCTLSFSDNQG